MTRLRRILTAGHGRIPAFVAPIALAVLGLTSLGLGVASQQHAPQPSVGDALPQGSQLGQTTDHTLSTQAGATGVAPLSAARPLTLDVPTIGVHHALAVLGRNRDATLQVPPLTQVATPGWDKYSPAPGQRGPAVILGHVDSARTGRGVFYRLGALHIGNPIIVTRADHTAAVFRVRGVNRYAKKTFPTFTVFGNTPDAQLRLITCGGDFDRAAHGYTDNIVVYATLASTHPVR